MSALDPGSSAIPPEETAPPGVAPERAIPEPLASEPAAMVCATHQVPLEPGKIELTYQGHTFPVDALRCPVCGLALIPEEMAKGRMREVEETLEQK